MKVLKMKSLPQILNQPQNEIQSSRRLGQLYNGKGSRRFQSIQKILLSDERNLFKNNGIEFKAEVKLEDKSQTNILQK